MKKYKGLAIVAITAIIISACTTALPLTNTNESDSDDMSNENTNESNDIEEIGVIEVIGKSTITINGQQIDLSDDLIAYLGLSVGDTVKVETETDDEGKVTAIEIEIISLANESTNDDDDSWDDDDNDGYDDDYNDDYDDDDDDD